MRVSIIDYFFFCFSIFFLFLFVIFRYSGECGEGRDQVHKTRPNGHSASILSFTLYVGIANQAFSENKEFKTHRRSRRNGSPPLVFPARRDDPALVKVHSLVCVWDDAQEGWGSLTLTQGIRLASSIATHDKR